MEKTTRSRLDRRPSKNSKTNTNKNINIKKTQVKKGGKRLSVFTLLAIGILIAVAIVIYLGVRWAVVTMRYKEYTDKMVSYGFNELYNNKEATSTEKVLNEEAIKVVIGSVINIKDISKVYYLADENISDAKNWYDYSTYIGVNSVIDKKELKEKVTKVDAAILLVNMLEGFQNVQLEPAKLNMSSKKLQNYTQKEQEAIAKAVTLGIIPNKNSALSNRSIIKGELNKMVIQIAEKYATMYYGNINGSNTSTIVTDKDKLPTNYMEYPYIVDSISKELYELKYNVRTSSTFKSPKETYNILGYLYGQIDEVLTRYFSKILNVNYETITAKDFLNSIQNDVVYKLNEQDVEQYVKYVKDQKIKLQGNATTLLPIIYFDGVQYVIRTEITFEVLNSNTEYNLLFGDENSKIKYDSKQITMYVDVPTGMAMGSNSILVYIDCLAEHIAKPTDLVVVEE